MSKRAYTLVELLIVTAITSIVVATLGLVFGFAAKRADHAMAEGLVLAQVTLLNDELERTISHSVACSARSNSNGTALMCMMPSNGVDRDADGLIDTYTTTEMGPTSQPKYGNGQRVTYYYSDSSGNPASVATASNKMLWRAWRADDAAPNTTDKDTAFALIKGQTNSRWNLIDRVVFSVNPTEETVTYTITANRLTRADRRSGGNGPDAREIVLSRTVNYMRNQK